MIPKIIHQTWKNTKIPDKWKEAVESCKEIYKGYKYMLWTDDLMKKFVKKEYPFFYKTYNEYPHTIQRCDAFRFLVIYKYGGIYIDMDVYCKKSITPLLKHDLLLVKSANYDTFTNCFMASVPEHPFIKYCIDKLIDHKDSYSLLGNHMHIMCSTGPFFINTMVNEYKLTKKDKYYIVSRKEFWGDCNVCTLDKCEGGTYFKHVTGNSWQSFDSNLYNGILCLYKKIVGS